MAEASYVPMFGPRMIDQDEVKSKFTPKSSVKEKQKSVIGSIDVTKALMLLGFSSWSSLEPGNVIDNLIILIHISNAFQMKDHK